MQCGWWNELLFDKNSLARKQINYVGVHKVTDEMKDTHKKISSAYYEPIQKKNFKEKFSKHCHIGKR